MSRTSPPPSTLNLSQQVSNWLINYWLPLGWLALLSGMFWIGDRALYHKLYYATLALPTLLALVLQPKQLKLVLSQPLIQLFLLFAAYMLLSILWADTDETPVSSIKRPLYIFMLFSSACLISQQNPRRLELVMEVSSGLAILCAMLSLAFFFYTGATGRLPGYGALYNPLLTAHVFGFFCTYWLSRWYLHKSATPLWPLIAFTALWALLIFTGSRTPLVALGACLLWLAINQWKHRLWVLMAAAVGLAIAMQPLLHSANLLERGLSYRPAIWGEALRQIQASPWFGLGYTHPQIFHVKGLNFALADTHNMEIGVLFSGGIVGLTLWLLIYAYAMRYAWLKRKDPAVLIASTLVVFGFAAGLTEGSSFFSRPKEHWFLIWIPLALLTATRLRQQQPFRRLS